MLNQVILIGRLVFDPELRVLEDGRKVCDITLAVQRPFKNIDGEYDTDFLKCTLWEGLAQSIDSYCKKGVMIALKGRIQAKKIELPDDKKITTLEIIGERITYLQSGKTKDPHLDDETKD